MRTRRRVIVLAAAAIMAVGTTAGCGSSDEVKKPTLIEGAKSGGKLTIGIDEDQPGLGLKEGDTLSGFDYETATYVAGALGVKPDDITWVEATPENREKLLEDGKVDLVVSTYSITDERKKVVDFAGPYFEAHQDLLIRLNDTGITGPKTLNHRSLCSVVGTTSAAYVAAHFKGDIDVREYPRFSDCVEALADGNVDAVTTDDVILAGYAASSKYKGELKVVGDGFTDELYGIGVQKGDTALVDQVNTALKQYIDSGAWKQALDKTVGPSGYDIPDPPTPGSS
jgi:glutamate transport system substrate-binding protein